MFLIIFEGVKGMVGLNPTYIVTVEVSSTHTRWTDCETRGGQIITLCHPVEEVIRRLNGPINTPIEGEKKV